MELQEAARRVVNENRDLRKLLLRQGLSDQEIQAQLSMLRAAEPETLPTSTQKESNAAPSPRRTPESVDSFESLFIGTGTPSHSEGYPDQFNLDTLFAVDPVWDFTQPPPSSSDSSPSEMDLCCSSFLPPLTTDPSPYRGVTDGSSFLPLSLEVVPPSNNATGDKSSSTPCTMAYALLKALNSRRRQQQDMLLVTLELLNGFRAAPEGDPEGCRVDNNVLILVMGKLLAA